MIDKDELARAIGAHGMWKTRLKQTIETGKTDISVDLIRQDDQCTFGKWLHGAGISEQDKASNHYRTVKDLHAKFHKCAARVADQALAGKRAEADRMLSLGGEYTEVSAKLTAAMMEWKKGLV
ncbi:MAG: CZB domain-containing protein [Gammaproteobacteria bacterium]